MSKRTEKERDDILANCELARLIPDEKAAVSYLENKLHGGGVPPCLECGPCSSYRTESGKPLPYRCRRCGNYFSLRDENIMAGSRLPIRKWLMAIHYIHASGGTVSQQQLLDLIGISVRTSCKITNLILRAIDDGGDPVVEAVKGFPEIHSGGRDVPSLAVDAHFKGALYKDISVLTRTELGAIKISKHVLHVWIKKYSNFARRYLAGTINDGKRIVANTGAEWWLYAKDIRVGGRTARAWVVEDTHTGYVLGIRLRRDNDSVREMVSLLRLSLENSASIPKVVIANESDVNTKAIEVALPGAEHRGETDRIGCNIVPAGSWSAPQYILDGWAIHNNFFRPAQSAGTTAAEAAGVSAQVPWKSWADVVEMTGRAAYAEE